jgi:hypothetical protein
MPVIVDEIVISVEVTNQASGGAAPAAEGAMAEDRQVLLSECVERVLDILRRKEER